MEKIYNLGTKVVMKKPHACGSNLWLIIRNGVDISIIIDSTGLSEEEINSLK